MSNRTSLLLVLAAVAALAAGCGSSSQKTTSAGASAPAAKQPREVNPPGDIPDTQAFVPYAPAGGGFSVKVPEGWARTGGGSKVTFSANLNSITIESRAAGGAVDAASAQKADVPAMAREFGNFKLVTVRTASRKAGKAVRIRFQDTAKPNPVTGRSTRESSERFLFAHGKREVVITLRGPKGADNVDPWRIVTDSLVFRP